MKTLLMSIKPEFARRIFSGEKRYELRRAVGDLRDGDVVVVYESSPTKAVIGAFVIGGVRRGSAADLWSDLGEDFGVTEDEYVSYFAGARTAHAIAVRDRVEVDPIPLAELRRRFAGFTAPQSYVYWREGVEELLGESAAHALGAA